MDSPTMHIAMYPWFAIGHITPFLYLSNKLAKRGHRISFFIPKRTQARFENLNQYPNLITFVPITIPPVDGLPHGAETTTDLSSSSLTPLLLTAMDHTEKDIELLLLQLKPQIVFFDFAYWVPNLARRIGIKSIQYHVISLAAAAHTESTQRQQSTHQFSDSALKLHVHEAQALARMMEGECGSGVRFYDRLSMGSRFSDVVGFKGCRELEGIYADYLETHFGKPVLLSGPVIPDRPTSALEENLGGWLGGFKGDGSVIYCAMGSECILQQNQFQELLLGLELTGFPFLAALKPPTGFESVEAALPVGFKERVQGRGIVHGGWVQQQLILEHPSVGCFITHCGSGSLLEALLSKCRLVFLPNIVDQSINARMLSRSLKVGVEIEKGEEDGLFTKESVCKAVKTVMDDESEFGKKVRANHAKFRSLLLGDDLESSYIDNLVHKLQDLLN